MISDADRRARLARRHALHPDHRRGNAADVADAVVALHATEAASVHLAVAARTDGVTADDVDRALAVDRTLVKQLAMRRTLFAFPRDLLPAVLGSAAPRVAASVGAALAKDLEKHGVTDDGEAWIAAARAAVVGRLSGGDALGTRQLREELPELSGRSTVTEGARAWETPQTFGPRLLTLFGVEGLIVRGANDGPWRLSRHAWTTFESWLGERPAPTGVEEGYAELVRRWLASYGPGTEADLVWWLGATKGAVRAALADVGAVAVDLEGGGTGYVLPGDDRPEEPVGTWAALLPVLDPTLMGWKERGFYLEAAHVPYLFDSNGNGGTTAWLDGRVVGCWVQDDDARVRVIPLERLSRRDVARLEREAERLTAFFDGVVVGNVYKSSLMKGEKLP